MVQKRKITLIKMKKIITVLIISFGLLLLGNSEHNEYPVPPKSEEMLFYIQRNHNKNTIIYDANFDINGNLIENKPIDVYWIRYEENGQRMELRSIEKLFAYGVKCSKSDTLENNYKVELVADEKRSFWLKQKGPFKADIYTLINKKPSQLNHLYINADNSGIWPRVKYIELFGRNKATGERTYEKINY
ncbi:MAG: hypothetical protein DRI95_15485 [Bacteroidetes bacterium]|nr:MAG: hypothetical protein DRI95_15485 [Bacteroidota bacterium]